MVVQAAEMKFNCFFLMPVIDVFPMKLREELEVAYDADLDAVFDIQAVRLPLAPPWRWDFRASPVAVTPCSTVHTGMRTCYSCRHLPVHLRPAAM